MNFKITLQSLTSFLNKVNKLFDYSQKLSDDTKIVIDDIIFKIISNIEKYSSLEDKLTFVNQNTFKEITNYNYVYYNKYITRRAVLPKVFHRAHNEYFGIYTCTAKRHSVPLCCICTPGLAL